PDCEWPFAAEAGASRYRCSPMGVARDRSAGSRKNGFCLRDDMQQLDLRARLEALKPAGYRIDIVYLWLCSPQLAPRRIAARVRQGGHNVPRVDAVRRFSRGWENFQSVYRPL